MSDELAPLPKDKFITGASIGAYRDNLIEKYREKHKGVLQKINENSDMSADAILASIVQDILTEGEELLGTKLMFEEEGNLNNATTVAIKRTDILKAVADVIAKKKELNQRSTDVDLNGPAFMLFQKMCFEKMVDVLNELQIDEEMVQLILSSWGKKMLTWGKELKNKLDEMAQ